MYFESALTEEFQFDSQDPKSLGN